jgi:flavin-dependent dehydrogenase
MDVGLEMANYHSQTMMQHQNYDVVIVGGGLAGLTSANLLAAANIKVLLIEKKTYPFHKVCGEYISNEVKPFLINMGLDLNSLAPSAIHKLRISNAGGTSACADLEMGGFGVSRYKLDNSLYELAIKKGAVVRTGVEVKEIHFVQDAFQIGLAGGEIIHSKLVIGSYGKRALLDKFMHRGFMQKRTGFMAVKYHIKTNYPENEIGLDSFKGGYCGISKIENDTYCLCYLVQRKNRNSYKTIREMEEAVLFKNPVIKDVFSKATFLYDKPEVINEISFDTKEQVVQHVWMCGDAAGLITPLCGNGMSMAIHGAKLACEIIIEAAINEQDVLSLTDRLALERKYQKVWKKTFKYRLFSGRVIQRLFLIPVFSDLFLFFFKNNNYLKKTIIKSTHGSYI